MEHSLEALTSPSPTTDREHPDFNYAAKIKWDEIMKRERVKHGNSAKYFHIYLPQSFNLQHSPSELPSNIEQNIFFLTAQIIRI